MAYLTTFQSCWEPLRLADASADDTAMDTSTPGTTYWDMTKKDCHELQPIVNGLEVIFIGEGDDMDYFGCRVFGKSHGGPAEALCELTGHYGKAFAPDDGSSTVDGTAYKMAENIKIDATNKFHTRDVTVADCSTDRAAKLHFDTAGLQFVYFEFYNIGDTTEVHNIMPYGRCF